MLAPRLRCSFESGFELINGDTSTIPEAEAVEIRSLITDAPGSYLGKVLGTVHISATKNTPLEERIMFKDTWCASPSGRHLLPPVLLLQDLLLGPTCILLLLQDLLLGPTCILPVHCLYTTCTIHAHYMYNACTLPCPCSTTTRVVTRPCHVEPRTHAPKLSYRATCPTVPPDLSTWRHVASSATGCWAVSMV